MEKLGIDFKLIVVQIINFGLLLFILKRVLYKPLLEVIKKKNEETASIDKGKQDLEISKKSIEEKEKEILLKTQKERKDLLLSAKREIESERKKIIEKANLDAKEILLGTKKQVERDKRKV